MELKRANQLDEDEFARLYRWLECPDAPYTRAVRILMLTGQRVEGIARLHVGQWDAKERIIDWSKTKNGRPHAIPVPELAAELIEGIIPNEYGWFGSFRRTHGRAFFERLPRFQAPGFDVVPSIGCSREPLPLRYRNSCNRPGMPKIPVS